MVFSFYTEINTSPSPFHVDTDAFSESLTKSIIKIFVVGTIVLVVLGLVVGVIVIVGK